MQQFCYFDCKNDSFMIKMDISAEQIENLT